MRLWLDAQISPVIAAWISRRFGIEVSPVRDLGLRDALDQEIFLAAKRAGALLMTKDSDFSALIDRLGTPPQVIWLRCGNTSNARLRWLLARALSKVLESLDSGEPIVEITDQW
jgi:predicted nuclease of predicted toxin-antitoxin system